MNHICIYIVEDDASLRAELSSLLSLQGYSVVCCNDFAAAAREAVSLAVDLAIVDLKLACAGGAVFGCAAIDGAASGGAELGGTATGRIAPGGTETGGVVPAAPATSTSVMPAADGLAITRDIRAASSIPVLVLTSSDKEFDEVMSMRLGADSYLTKPYSPAVLLAHVERMLARSHSGLQSAVSWGGVSIDASRSEVTYNGNSVDLTRNELRILVALARARGGIVSRVDLMYELWQSDEFVDDNTLTVNVNRLRKSLASLGVPEGFLKTHRGQGYSL